jgi:CSLREA domain-containing protein
LFVLLATLFGGALMFAPAAHAKPSNDIVVTTTLDESNPNDGLCSLREATNVEWTLAPSGPAAGECPAGTGNDTIILPDGTFTLTDTVAGPIYLYRNTWLVGASIPGMTTIVQGGVGWNNSIVHVSSPANAMISNVTIRGGNIPTSGYGGGIYVDGGSTLALMNSIVTNNNAYLGGGIFNSGGTLTVTNSTIQLNTAAATGVAGGLYNAFGGHSTLVNTNVLTNTAPGAGGIYNSSTSVMSITGGNIISNTAQTSAGGGIWNANGSSVSINGTVLTKNAAPNSNGGGIYNQNNSAITITNAIVNNNLAMNGGGIHSTTPDSTLVIDASSVSGNIATSSGGGIESYGVLTISNSTIANNTANLVNGLGGGLLTEYTTTITNTTISTNKAYEGAGIDANNVGGNPSVRISCATIVGNQATYLFGGLYGAPGTTTYLRSTILAANQDTIGFPDCGGTITTWGFNLIGNNNNCTFVPIASDQVGTNASPIDPKIAPLGNYGGPAQTHGLFIGSPALAKMLTGDNGCGTVITTDQRGYPRPRNGKCNIGAFEGVLYGLYLPLIKR